MVTFTSVEGQALFQRAASFFKVLSSENFSTQTLPCGVDASHTLPLLQGQQKEQSENSKEHNLQKLLLTV